jgi:amino acid transporter
MVALPGAALFQLIATGTIIGVAQYLMTMVLYLAVRRKFDRGDGGFDLGRFDRLVAVAALVWVVICLFTVLVSFTTMATLLVVVGLLGAGFAYFLYMWKFDRAVLEHEPGEPDLFTVSAE